MIAEEAAFEQFLWDERPQLVRWCARLVGSVDVAEDLAQEALSAAWRSKRRPARSDEYAPWLAGIARNLCRSWLRRRRREQLHQIAPEASDAMPATDIAEQIPDALDVEIQLERDELAHLLDRAMALLPTETRAMLVAKYIEESPLAEIAGRLGMTESAAASRLHRGKLALRQVLTTNLLPEAAAYGIEPAISDGWQSTRIWCPSCGNEHLLGKLERTTGKFAMRCAGCYARSQANLAEQDDPLMFGDIKSYRVALNRITAWSHAFYRKAISERSTPCPTCGNEARGWRALPDDMPDGIRDMAALIVRCTACRQTYVSGLSGLALSHPEAQKFWRANPRIQTLDDRAISFAGQPALLTSFISRSGGAQLDIISHPHDFAVLHIAEGHQS